MQPPKRRFELKNDGYSLKNDETKIETVTKEIHWKINMHPGGPVFWGVEYRGRSGWVPLASIHVGGRFWRELNEEGGRSHISHFLPLKNDG